MTRRGFNPYKVANYIIKYREQKELLIFGSSSEKNGYIKSNQIDELLDKLEGFGYSLDDSYTHPYNLSILEPFESPHKLNLPLIQYIITGSEKLIFIGCPHDFIKKIKFNKNSIIIDLWGIVKDKKANVIREI